MSKMKYYGKIPEEREADKKAKFESIEPEVVQDDAGGGKVRDWFITINNPEGDECTKVSKLYHCGKILFYACCIEIGDSGTIHFHMIIYFKSGRYFGGIKKMFPKADIRKVMYMDKAIEYIKKTENNLSEGNPPQMGHRTDLDEVRQMIDDGLNIKQIAWQVKSGQAVNLAEKLIKYQDPPDRRNKMTVLWVYGGPGKGKSYMYYTLYDLGYSVYKTSARYDYFDGYYGQDVFILNELKPNKLELDVLLEILDIYPYRVNIKGTSVWMRSHVIIVTSSHRPESLFNLMKNEDIDQLTSRMTDIINFDDLVEGNLRNHDTFGQVGPMDQRS